MNLNVFYAFFDKILTLYFTDIITSNYFYSYIKINEYTVLLIPSFAFIIFADYIILLKFFKLILN